MGVDVAQADLAIISHGHLDHGGALKDFLAVNDHAKVYMKSSAMDTYKAKLATGERIYIGLDQKLKEQRSTRLF